MTTKNDASYMAGFSDGCDTMTETLEALQREIQGWRLTSYLLASFIGVIGYVVIGRMLWIASSHVRSGSLASRY
jgi:hypothetical protein